MTIAQREIYMAANPQQAHLLKNALGERGIVAWISNESLQVAVGDLPWGVPTATRVLVEEHDAQQARQIALDFEQASRQALLAPDDDSDDGHERAWPRCLACNRPRLTSCPICGTAGSNFRHGFMPEGSERTVDDPVAASRGPLVICGTCDEPFEAEFAARCEWCGYRFADGRELPTPRPAIESEFNARVWIVLAGLAWVLLSVVAWFAWITPSR